MDFFLELSHLYTNLLQREDLPWEWKELTKFGTRKQRSFYNKE